MERGNILSRSTVPIVLAVAFLLAIPAGFAGHCGSWTTSTASAGAGGVYVITQSCGSGCIALWVYVESNNIGGLQRNDSVRDDTCHGLIVSDTRVV